MPCRLTTTSRTSSTTFRNPPSPNTPSMTISSGTKAIALLSPTTFVSPCSKTTTTPPHQDIPPRTSPTISWLTIITGPRWRKMFNIMLPPAPNVNTTSPPPDTLPDSCNPFQSQKHPWSSISMDFITQLPQ